MGDRIMSFCLGFAFAMAFVAAFAIVGSESGAEGCREATGAESCQLLWVPERGVGNGG